MDCTLGILAHVDAGKTTLSEQLLYRSGALRQAGRVDHGTAALDFDPVERARGVTIYTAQADFDWGGTAFHLLDTPGHPDFAPEMERVLSVLDLAVVVVSAADGIQGHTRTIWQLLRRLGVPTLFFINKVDQPSADPAGVRAALAGLSPDCAPYTAEEAAGRDEAFFERYLEGDETGWQEAARRAVQRCGYFPVLEGAALTGDGVEALLDALAAVGGRAYDPEGEPSARIYQIRRDRTGARWALAKVLSGTLRPRMTLGESKLGELRRWKGARSENLPCAPAGTLCAIGGLAAEQAGQGLGGAADAPAPVLTPLLAAEVVCGDPHACWAAVSALADEEPALHAVRENDAITVRFMGPIELEILQGALADRFGLHVTFGPPRVLYRETIAAPVDGIGHFEPLRHYAEVHVRLEPLPAGSGITFGSDCPTDVLPRPWQRLVEHCVFAREQKGVLTGAPLTDVRVVLTAGRTHEKHTEGGDFREATWRAIRQALMKAENVLLEPRLAVTARVSPTQVGRLLADFDRMGGEADPPAQAGADCIVTARVPVRTWGDYPAAFAAVTRGAGTLDTAPADWVPCPAADAVIAAAGYDPEADLEHTPDSVFCSHGAGYPVKWYDADAAAHITVK